jgi:hypothetical protein
MTVIGTGESAAADCAVATVASVEPSSTTITSNAASVSWAMSRASVSVRMSTRLNVGMMTLSSRVSGSG